MGKIIAFIAVSLAALLLAGCIQPVQKVGCCLRGNATQGDEDDRGCVLYNISDFKIYDLIADTIGPCDDESRNLTGHCLVDLGIVYPPGEEGTAIPICTEDDLGTCFEPDCLAMVCGDFKYSPRVAPGFSTVDEMEGRTPPETEGENTRNFYEAQCRFLPMDTRLRSTMSNSNSLINVFRLGVGETFAEYDQYRYYFPMSDRYCSLDVNLEGDAGIGDEGDKVDRYMNYIGEGMTEYDPIAMEEDCLDDSDEVPPPFRFGFDSYPDTIGLGSGTYSYNITEPDMSGYLFKEYARYVIPARPDGRFDEDDLYMNMQFKEIDDGYYRKALTTAYYDSVFSAGGFARAPFECDSGGFDCYSGDCDTSVYNRGVFMLGEPGADETTWDPVAANCNEETDALGKKLISCLPVKDAFKSGGSVDVDYAPVNVVPWLVRVELDGYAANDLAVEDDANPPDSMNGCCGEDRCTPYEEHDWSTTHVCSLRWEWMDVTGNCWFNEGDCHARWAPSGTSYDKAADVYAGLFSIEKLPEDFGYERYDVDNEAECDAHGGTCEYNEGDGWCYCPYVADENEYPPAAKVELFGKYGDNDYENVVWHDDFDGRDKTVLGYASVADGQFQKLSLVKQCSIGPEDYVMVILGDPASPDDYRTSTNSFTRLQWAFRPYLNHRIDALANTQWQESDRMLDGDIIFSTMPWVIAYKRGSYDGGTFNTETKHYTEPINYYMERNYLDEPVPYDYSGVGSDELRRAYAIGNYKNYVMLTTERIYLLTDGNGDGKLGSCVLDDTTGLPVVETYGWCKPCTASTLAYQWMTTNKTTYIPYSDVDLEGMGGSIICEPDVSVDCSGGGGCVNHYTMSCAHPEISDIDVYNGEAIPRGSPRTIPEASYMKQKLELFMKSGIMPVLDFSDPSNWNLTYMAGSWAPGGHWEGIPEEYDDYDLRYLLNDRGSMIVIVDTVSRFIGTESVEPQRIAERANIVRQACPRCLTAVAVRTASNDTLDEVLGDVFSDPRNSLVIDMVAIDYSPNWKEPVAFYQSDDAVNRSLEVVDDMASYAQVSLVGYGKPAIITKFYVSEWVSEVNGGLWNEDTFETMFSTVVVNQDKLLKAGIIGVIFSPARSEYGISDSGVVDEYSGVGEKTAKFCALERAANRMSDVPTTAMFTPIMLQYNVQCINCTELEMARGLCMDAAMTECDNGAICKHEFEDRNSVKCPENTITQLTSAHPCDVCSEGSGTYVCDYTYVDGTIMQRNYSSNEIVSDAYAEVIAGTPRPDKCCLQTESGEYYSYAKIDMRTPVVRPVMFSKSGNPEQDCGMSTTMQASELSFCGFNMPLKEYDINCTFVPG